MHAFPEGIQGEIAQSVEQTTENPCVPSSILGLATIIDQRLTKFVGFYIFLASDTSPTF